MEHTNITEGFTMKPEEVFINENGKRFQTDEDQVMGSFEKKTTYATAERQLEWKRQRLEKKANRKPPVCTLEDPINPIVWLNQCNSKLEFTFDSEVREGLRMKYTCKVKVSPIKPVGDESTTTATVKIEETDPEKQEVEKIEVDVKEPEVELTEIVGDGLNKKDAKKKCAFLALCFLYPDSFKPPQEIIDTYERDYTIPKKPDQVPAPVPVAAKNNFSPVDEKSKMLMNVQKKMKKLCTKAMLQTKTSCSLLHELCIPIAETGKEIINEQTVAVVLDKKFKYEYRNALINPESLKPEEFYLYIAQGHGLSKKDAKQHAAKQALKQFLDCDIEQILMTPDLPK